MKKIWWFVALFLALMASFSHAESWSVGPERWFIGTKEVPTGTPGAVSGEILARQNLTDHRKEYRDSFFTEGLSDGPKDKCHEHHGDKKLVVVGGGYFPYGYSNQGYDHQRNFHKKYSHHHRHHIKRAHHHRGKR